MARIKIHKNMAFNKARGEVQSCSFCSKNMKGNWGVIIKKETGHSIFYIWICLECINEFADFIKKELKEKWHEIIYEAL